VTRVDLLRTLGATPDRINDLARQLSPAQLWRQPKDGEWSIGEIVNHLLVGERDVILPRLQRMRVEHSPVFPSSAATRSGFGGEPKRGDFDADLNAFRTVRAETLAFLDGLHDAEWQRSGTTPTRGTLTLEAYARYLAEHDLEHLAQIAATRAVVAG